MLRKAPKGIKELMVKRVRKVRLDRMLHLLLLELMN